MGKKVFVSYKYKDISVQPLKQHSAIEQLDPGFSITREYVDYLADKIELSDNIYKGEEGNNDLSEYSDEYIEEELKKRISDSSVTIIFISPGMRVFEKPDRDQWIPWEVSYSLKEITRDDKTSHTNALLAVVLPDSNGSYAYCIEKKTCCAIKCRSHRTDWLFDIMRDNTFNQIVPDCKKCSDQQTIIYYGEPSYMPIVLWKEFIIDPATQIDRVCVIRDSHKDEYKIRKDI